jgi:serine/threonine protein kinase/Flp pilus assembly protein TadD
MSSVPIEDRLGELLLRWDELRRQGCDPSAAELCADCPELADELRRRIGLVRDMDSVLDVDPTRLGATPGDGAPDGFGVDRRLPDVLSALAVYRPQRHHAQGGLGEVLAVRQEELDRLVALKRIRPDRLHEAARRRFLREATITARLQHPGIVPIYSLGLLDDDGPFYTMPFIRGRTLQEAIEEFHGDASLRHDSGRRSLRLRELLQRLIAVCNTMAYAHDREVIHRDLKPSNIMLGPYGETLVMDWGLAKRVGADNAGGEAEGDTPSPSLSPSPDAVTATGAVLGTPHYMSPEQARGEPVGPASDVFSLGLVLYAILTGKSPYADAVLQGVDPLEAVRGAKVVPPCRRDPGLSRALEAICLKALAARPEDRYPTPRALEDDLSKWLADEPVSAWPEGWGSRLARWARRHQTWVKAGTAALILVAAVSVLAALGIQSALTRAEANAREARLQRQRASRHFGDIMLEIGDVVQSLLDTRQPTTPEARVIRRDAALKIDQFMRNWTEKQGRDPTLQPEGIKARHTHATLLRLLGDAEASEREHQKAVEDTERLVSLYPTDPTFRVELGQAYEADGTRSWSTNPPDASELFAKATEQYILATRLAPDNPIILNQRAWFLVICPDPAFRDYDQAISWATKALSVAERPDQARTWNTIGVARYRKGDWSGAIAALTKAAQLRFDDANDTDCFVLAMAHWQRGERNQANTWYSRAIAWLDRRNPLGREETIFYAEASSLLGRRD